MDISVTDVDGLPAHTYISVRYGESRRQAPFRSGEVLTFPVPASGDQAKAYTVDVFRKVGSKQVSLAGITAIGGQVVSENLEIPSLEIQGSPITASLTASLAQAKEKGGIEDSKRAQVAARAKAYLEKHGVQSVLHEMFAQLLERCPGDPLAFMVDFLEQQREEIEELGAEPLDYEQEPGLSDVPLPGFADGESSEALPDLSKHHSIMVDVLRKDMGLYDRVCGEKTDLGVTLAQCIKPGVDCPGHELVKVAGAFAGDAQCYEVFRELFDPMIGALHPGCDLAVYHPMEGNPAKVSNSRIDPTGKYAVFSSIEVRRNFKGLRFLPCCSKEERRQSESLLVSLLGDPSVKGSYLPLRRSESYAPKVGGMTAHQEERLRGVGMLFAEPDSRMRLSAGLGRHWPDARGVLVGEVDGVYAFCNEEDHLRFFARQHTSDMKKLWLRLNSSLMAIEAGAKEKGYGYASSKRLGYLTACPSRLGSAMRCTISLKVPLLAASTDLPALCRSFDMQPSQEVSSTTHGNIWHITSGDCLGVSEVDIINGMIEGCRTLVELEMRLERGEPIYDAMPGLGGEASPGFPIDRCPARLPDLSGSHSFMAATLGKQPQMYKSLKSKKTSMGVGLAPCVKPGMDDPGHPAQSRAGLVAGDGECYEIFRDLFDPVIGGLHGDSVSQAAQPVDTDMSRLEANNLAALVPHIASVRVELRRNLQGLLLAPCCTGAERKEVERLLVKSILAIPEDLSGEYTPLACSMSYAPRPGGVSLAEQARLVSAGLLFSEPYAPARLAAGLGREWPDSRGAFLDEKEGLTIWCNEEDHIRFIFQQEGGDLSSLLGRAFACSSAIEAQLKGEGSGFLREERLGYLTVDPANLGSALRCAICLRLPRLSAHPDFPQACKALGVEATWRTSAWELASGSGLGTSEIDLVNALLKGCAKLVQLEEQMQQGRAVEGDLKALLG